MQSAAMQEAADRGAAIFPVCVLELVARGLSLGSVVVSTAGRLTALGQVTHVSIPGGWDEIRYGSGIEEGRFETVRTGVIVGDPDRELLRRLEAYQPRGSAARIDWAAEGLGDTDWEPLFRGVLEDWAHDGLNLKFLLKTDESVLRTPVPPKAFARTEWSSASDSTIYETAVPLSFGIFDSFAITGRGMVPAVNVRYDKDLGYWWWASAGHQRTIRRLYYDGTAQDETGWSIVRGVYGSALATFISITEGYQPEKGVVVSFDCEGPDEDGLYAGASITNPVTILRTVLEEYVYRAPSFGAWRGAHPIIDATSWNAAAAWFEARGYECAKHFGGDQNPESGAAVIQSFLDEHPFVRIEWTPLGTLAMTIIDHDDVDPDDNLWFEIDKHHEGGRVQYAPGDEKEVVTHLKVPYMWSPAEQKFLGGLWAHDVAALPGERVEREFPNSWTQGRFSQEEEET